MPRRTSFQHLARSTIVKSPSRQALVLRTLDVLYQVVLFPFRRRRVAAPRHPQSALVGLTDTYNEAAERYFRDFLTPQFLLDKPFSETLRFGKHLIDVGVLVDGMRLQPGDVVLELGAGSCWLSHMLNRFGCRTIAVDVSQSALALGKVLFEREAATNWALRPEFAVYNGHRLPVADNSCDRIIINDAFHHVPNQRELLVEMYRVLRRSGVVGMAEPGAGHGTTAESAEAARTGVLENELVIEDLAALAHECGFSRAAVLVASPSVKKEIPAQDLGAFMGGKGFSDYWKRLCSALEQHHYILLYKDEDARTTARPGVLNARIRVEAPSGDYRLRPGDSLATVVTITNVGDTQWQAEEGAGWTRLGVHLDPADEREAADFDWFRAALPRDVSPGETVTMNIHLPRIDRPGTYVATFDLVVEGMTWFVWRGSHSTSLDIVVSDE
jgi:ubiquinone/menaquinone biosynthesis C-methylase UbiE